MNNYTNSIKYFEVIEQATMSVCMYHVKSKNVHYLKILLYMNLICKTIQYKFEFHPKINIVTLSRIWLTRKAHDYWFSLPERQFMARCCSDNIAILICIK